MRKSGNTHNGLWLRPLRVVADFVVFKRAGSYKRLNDEPTHHECGRKTRRPQRRVFFLDSRHHSVRLLRNHGDPFLVDLDLLDQVMQVVAGDGGSTSYPSEEETERCKTKPRCGLRGELRRTGPLRPTGPRLAAWSEADDWCTMVFSGSEGRSRESRDVQVNPCPPPILSRALSRKVVPNVVA